MTGIPAATILHADLDSFYASVEQRDNPVLRGRPVIVGGGVVLAASYEAKAFGVRTPMPGHEARSLCPRAVVVRPRFEAYSEASKAVFEIFRDTTPIVEGISVDEAFLDVSGLRMIAGDPEDIARRLRERVRDEVGLPISVGGARSKFLAKVASAACKPDGLRIVAPGTELAFLHPLPVRRLWGVGAVTERRLADAGISTVGDLAALGAFIAGFRAGRVLAVEGLGEDARDGGLADPAGAGEQIGVVQAAGGQRVGQGTHHVLLADEGLEAARAPLAGKYLIGHGGILSGPDAGPAGARRASTI